MFAFEGWNLPWYDEFWGSDDHDGGPEGGDPEDDYGNDEEDFQEEGEEESESETSSTSYPRPATVLRGQGHYAALGDVETTTL